jgi:hypothetical protein
LAYGKSENTKESLIRTDCVKWVLKNNICGNSNLRESNIDG